MQALEYAEKTCETIMRRNVPADLPPAGRFYYHQGVFLSGMYQTWRLTKKQEYFDYIKNWVDTVMDENGITRQPAQRELDHYQAGILLFPLLDATGEDRYRKGLDRVIDELLHMPRTSEGAPWHKAKNPDQMWLDGLYMCGPLGLEYARRYRADEVRNLMLCHVRTMFKHTLDPETGLMYHAWDESRRAEWADPQSGHSAEFWGRAIGWALIALADDLDQLEEDSSEYGELRELFVKLMQSVCRYQSEEGRWYQVVNKGECEGNWLENSCSCLYTAALYRGLRKGYLEESYEAAAQKAYEAVIRTIEWKEGDIQVGQVCVGTNVGDYRHYCERPVSVNDLHGMGAFIMMCVEKHQA